MNEQANFPPLGDDEIVYRVVTKNSWFDQDTNELLPIAFKLRTGEHGISVSYNCTVREAHTSLNSTVGVARLVVGTIRGIDQRLDVVPDEPKHAEIQGVPHEEEDEELATYFADLLASISKVVLREKYTASKF